MKKIHIFAPQNHSNRSVCDVGKMASHSFVTRHCEAVQRHDHSNIGWLPHYNLGLYNPKPRIRVGYGYFHE